MRTVLLFLCAHCSFGLLYLQFLLSSVPTVPLVLCTHYSSGPLHPLFLWSSVPTFLSLLLHLYFKYWLFQSAVYERLPKMHNTCLDEILHGSTFLADVISSFLSCSVIAFRKLITQADDNKRWKGWTSWSSIILWQWLFENRSIFELTIPTALNFRHKT